MRTILFDLGNVLVRYEHDVTMAALAALYGADASAVRDAYALVGLDFGLGQLAAADVLERLNRRFGCNVDAGSFAQAFCAGLARDDGALAYVLSLQERQLTQVGAISNTNELHVAWLDRHVPELAEFELVMMSNEVHCLKPDPEIFELALELLDVPAAQVLYVDDLTVNVEAARALGLAGIVHADWAATRPQIEAWLAAG